MGSRLLKAAPAAGLVPLALLVYSRLKRPVQLGVAYSEAPTKVLVVGGGFGGLAAAEGLARALSGSQEVGVGLLDRHNYTTFWPMVPSAISGNIEVRHAASPLRRVLRPLGVEFLQAEVEGVDFENRNVHTDGGDFPYDYLILALGSRTAFFGSGADEHAFDLKKGLTKAVAVRNHVLDCFEEAERLRGEHGDDLLTFVFVGGGTTGVEGISDTHDLIFGVLEEDYSNVDFDRVRLVLVNADDTILKGVDPALAHAASLRRPHHSHPHHGVGRGNRARSPGRGPGRAKGPPRTHTRGRVPAREGPYRCVRRRRLLQLGSRRSTSSGPRPGRRAGGQEGRPQPRRADPRQGTEVLPLPLTRPARGPRGGQRGGQYPGRQVQRVARGAHLEERLPLRAGPQPQSCAGALRLDHGPLLPAQHLQAL